MVDEGSRVNQIDTIVAALVVIIAVLIMGGIFSEPIAAFVRRRLPGFTYEGEVFLIFGSLVIAAFIIGLVVMYILLRS